MLGSATLTLRPRGTLQQRRRWSVPIKFSRVNRELQNKTAAIATKSRLAEQTAAISHGNTSLPNVPACMSS